MRQRIQYMPDEKEAHAVRKFYSIILLCSFILSLLFPESIKANGTSFYKNAVYPTGHVLPMEDGVVSIVREKLFIDIQQDSAEGVFNTDNPSMRANIRVQYEMLNETDEDMVVPVAFPQPGDSNQWNITLDDKDIVLKESVKISESELIGSRRQLDWIHPRTGEEYDFDGYDVLDHKSNIESKTFDVSLTAGETHMLEIKYVTKLGVDESHSLHPVYRLDYLLHPASYWSDFKDLSIGVDVPEKSSVHMNLPLKEEGSHTYIGDFQKLPEENLALFISPSSGSLVNLFNSRGQVLWFLVGLLIMFYIITSLATRKIKVKYTTWFTLVLLGVVVFAGFDIFTHKIIGYPFTFLQFVGFMVYTLVLLLIWVNGVKTIWKSESI